LRAPATNQDEGLAITSWALGVEGIVRHKCELLLLHLATVLTRYAADLEVEVDPEIAAGEIPDAAPAAIVPAALCPSTGLTGRFFERRTSLMTRA